MRMSKPAAALLLAAVGLTIALYARGLDGPFLFDDSVHITQNRWVKIDSLAWPDLVRAWNSSFSGFPGNRPLAQLTFGINHAFAGLDPRAFKTTNLVIHLVNGLLVFLFTRLALGAVKPRQARDLTALSAAVVATAWLLHPIQVSTVLYTVQRMTLLSTTSLLIGLNCYLYGRIRIAAGRPGRLWMLTAAPVALVGFLAKENAALMPLLLLVAEVTLLRGVVTGAERRFVNAVRIGYIAIPLLLVVIYLVAHPVIFTYDGRPFTMAERLMTQPRVLWTYLRWLVAPDLSAFGLFHDDIPVSKGWFEPVTTLPAVLAWLATVAAALVLRRRAPLFAFAVLFFLACHALESSIFPLEMVFEHRNYLAAVAPMLLLADLVVVESRRWNWPRSALGLGALLLVAYTTVTGIRVGNWMSFQSFVLSAAEHHPDSRRSNFLAAQALISMLGDAKQDAGPVATAADGFLDRGLAIDPDCIDCLFGKVILSLHLGQQPSPTVLKRLQKALATADVGPTNVAVSQFSFLVRWNRSNDVTRLPDADVTSIFDAALRNPGWNNTGRAGIESAYREYHEFVTGRLDQAEHHARAAIRLWPKQWGYHAHLVGVLRKQGRLSAAREALEKAAASVRNADQQRQLATLRAAVDQQIQQAGHAH